MEDDHFQQFLAKAHANARGERTPEAQRALSKHDKAGGLGHGVELRPNGLILPRTLSYEAWLAVGDELKKYEAGIQWWIGDWINYGEARWGEKYAQALEETGFDYQTLQNQAYVARAFEISPRGEKPARRENLSWSHHRAVAALKPAEADELLSRAEAEQLTTREIEREATIIRHTLAEPVRIAPQRVQIAVQPGEWWALGDHRMYCGDTSEAEFVSEIPPAAFTFADPPYNAGAAEWDNDFNWRHDWLIDVSPIVVVTPGIASIFDFARVTTMPYRWAVSCWIDNGMTRGAMGFGNWIYAAVFALGSIYRNHQDFFKVSINTSDNADTDHKGRKPAQFISELMDLYSGKEDVVIDPFLGSGTTLLVAEKSGRICYGGEISPVFCGDIIARWESMTGKTAERIK